MIELAKNKRKASEPTVPSTIGEEFKYNPFMRVREESVKKYAGKSDPVDVMGHLRHDKDMFRAKH